MVVLDDFPLFLPFRHDPSVCTHRILLADQGTGTTDDDKKTIRLGKGKEGALASPELGRSTTVGEGDSRAAARSIQHSDDSILLEDIGFVESELRNPQKLQVFFPLSSSRNVEDLGYRLRSCELPSSRACEKHGYRGLRTRQGAPHRIDESAFIFSSSYRRIACFAS